MSADATITGLVREHGKWLVAFLRGLIGDDHDAEDAFQETWLRVLKSKIAFRGEGARSYLARTARSVAIDRLRRRRPVESLDVEVEEDGASAAETIADEAPTPGERYESKATSADVRAAIASLAPKLREVVLMRVEGEMEFKDIAAELGVPLGTALTWMRRATEELKEKLGRNENGRRQGV